MSEKENEAEEGSENEEELRPGSIFGIDHEKAQEIVQTADKVVAKSIKEDDDLMLDPDELYDRLGELTHDEEKEAALSLGFYMGMAYAKIQALQARIYSGRMMGGEVNKTLNKMRVETYKEAIEVQTGEKEMKDGIEVEIGEEEEEETEEETEEGD